MAEAPPTANAPAAANRGGGSLVVIVLGLLVLLFGGATIGGVWWRMSGSGAAGDSSASGSEAIAPEPPGPPPPHAAALAVPTVAVAADQSLAVRLAGIASEVESSLRGVSFDGSAPSPLTVQGGGRQADNRQNELPRHERWEIRFPPGGTIETYARQLDFFKIELGAIGVEDHVSYLSNLSNPKPKTRPGIAAEEKRLYLVWQRGAMREADEQLAKRAGLAIEGKVLAHFIPPEVEEELVRLEDAFARQLGLQKVGNTVFGIRAAGQDNFRFYVIEQKPALR